MTRRLVALFVLAAPLAAAPEPDTALLARARAILEQAPLIDTHNDLPSMLIERNDGDLTGLDLGVVHPELCADIPMGGILSNTATTPVNLLIRMFILFTR